MFNNFNKEQKRVLLIAKKDTAAQTAGILQRLGVVVLTADHLKAAAKLIRRSHGVIFHCEDFQKGEFFDLFRRSRKKFMVVASAADTKIVRQAYHAGAKDCVFLPYNLREFILRFNAFIQNKVRIACIGGGTGLFTVLMGIKTISGVMITSIVSMSDDGGSSGRLRASFGILPPGDVRRSLVALSNAPQLMSDVLQYRFDKQGDCFAGHNFGNLFLTVLTQLKGSMREAVNSLGDILNIQGIVLPVTDAETTLCAEFADGRVIHGESKIDLCEGRSPDLRIKNVWLEPQNLCTPAVYSAIINSDLLVIGPGDLYTSVIANLLVAGVAEAIKESPAKKIYVCNLMTKPGETSGLTAEDHIREIVKYLKGDCLDYCLLSNTVLSGKALADYALKNQFPVELKDPAGLKEITSARVILADLGHEEELVRHDSLKIKSEISRFIR